MPVVGGVGVVQTQGQMLFGVEKLRSVKFPSSKIDGTSVLIAENEEELKSLLMRVKEESEKLA